MAFLCPARRKRSKVKIKGPRPLEAPLPGRITGSASIDTLVRVGIEKEQGPRARMVVLHDFTPCVDDELSVKRGQEVHVLYQENDWMYVIADDGREGFIPYTYCLPVQRCAEDFVTPEPNHHTKQKQQTSNKHNNNKQKNTNKDGFKDNSKPTYQFATIAKTEKSLTRKSSKSLPDISDLNVSTAARSNQNRYPVDVSGQRQNRYVFEEEEDKTYGMSLTRQSRSTHRRTRSISQDPTSPSSRPSSARASQSQPASPVRSTDYMAKQQDQRSRSNPGTPRHTLNYPNNAYSSSKSNNKYNRHSAGSDLMQHSWNPPSGQSLVGQVGGVNLAASYPANNQFKTNRYSGSYQHSPSSQISQSLSYNSNLGSSYHTSLSSRENNNHIHNSLARLQEQQSQVEMFEKTAKGEYIVLFSFSPHQENDIGVERGEFVTVLNTDDSDWLWVRRSDNQEGFVPINYLMKIEPTKQDSASSKSPKTSYNPPALNQRSNNVTSSSYQSPHVHNSGSSSNSHQHPSSNTRHYINSNTHQLTATRHSSNNQYTSSRHNSNIQQLSSNRLNSNSSNQGISPNINIHGNSQNQLSTSISNTNNLSPKATINHNYQEQNSSRQIENTSGATRIMCLYKYAAQAPDDLAVTKGEWVYANMSQADPDWLWVYSPSQKKSGYVPRTYTKTPTYGIVSNSRDHYT